MGLKERARERTKRMVAHKSHGFDEAEAWDLTYWLQQTPQQRLSALVAIRNDVAKVESAREKGNA